MIQIFGVASESYRDGALLVGPARRAAWSPALSLSYALAYVVHHEPVVHPWDSWPNPKDPRRDICPPPPKAKRTRTRKAKP